MFSNGFEAVSGFKSGFCAARAFIRLAFDRAKGSSIGLACCSAALTAARVWFGAPGCMRPALAARAALAAAYGAEYGSGWLPCIMPALAA
mmetsp:Transcript_17251/g.51638  ORF Transcript_17251/g.51638 Transcript_17251/m.51638 type:complete len:90 (+) Transcript_17251:433-702(+)